MRIARIERRGLERLRLRAQRKAQRAVLAFMWSHAAGNSLPNGGTIQAARVTAESSVTTMRL